MRSTLRSVGVVVAMLLAIAVGTSSASAELWTYHQNIGPGANVFGPYVGHLVGSEVTPWGVGIGCAGIRYIGLTCPLKAEVVEYRIGGGGFTASEPYMHNHSTFETFLNGQYWES